MNASHPASPADAFPLPPLPMASSRPVEPVVHLPRLLIGLALAVGIFDLCFWKVRSLGLSQALFALALAGIILFNRETKIGNRTTRLMLGLLLGATLATVIETSFTNSLVLMVLLVALAGHSYFTKADSLPGRVLSQVVALLFAPGRIFWLAARLMEAFVSKSKSGLGGIFGGLMITVPAIVLTVLFGTLLASGNAVFGNWTDTFFHWFWKQLDLYLDVARITLWMFAAFIMLPLLRPTFVSDWWWKWTERLPRLPDIVPARGAFLSSGLVLVVLNLLFLIANVADAIFLWSGQSLPTGITYSGFVHHGVNTLIITVILSAVVMVMIFQQPLNIARRRELKALAFFWIAQNLFVLLSVARRLELYIEAYDMTVARLSVMIFLALVAVGFGLLAVKILKDCSLSWLIGGCALAVLTTFYIAQFLNLQGWSADYNVAQWDMNRARTLDTSYLQSLGPAAWPALRRAHELDPDNATIGSALQGSTSWCAGQSQFDGQHWREFSLRAWLNRDALNDKK